MKQITTVGVDLAKEVIVVCARDAQGRSVYFKQFSFAGFACVISEGHRSCQPPTSQRSQESVGHLYQR
jgi:hypothetical protein